MRLLARWRTVEESKPFLYATAMNLLRDHWRAASRQQRLLDRLRRITPQVATTRERWLPDLAARLPDRLRSPLMLFYAADLSVDEVATAVGRPVGSVKRQLAEGRVLVQAMLEHDPDAEEAE